jgi:hypothetical protein
MEMLAHQFDNPAATDHLNTDVIDSAKRHGKLFDVLTYGSVVLHEMRHFHEFLASAYGSRLMFDHLLLASLTAPVRDSLAAEDAIAIPITSWATMTSSNYAKYAQDVKPATLRRTPPDLTTRLIEMAQPVIGSIESLGLYPFERWDVDQDVARVAREFDLSFLQLLEGGPTTCQISHLGEMVGADATGEFCETLRKRDSSRTYTQMWNLWYTLERKFGLSGRDLTAPGISHTIRNALTFYCLSARNADGHAPADRDEADDAVSAADAFVGVWAHLLDAGIPTDEQIVDWLDEHARRYNLMTLAESVETTIARTRQRATDLPNLAPPVATPGGPLITPNLVQFYEAWASAQQHLGRWILANPTSFFDPKRYRESLPDLVAAAYIIESDADTSPWFTIAPGPVWEAGPHPAAPMWVVYGSTKATLGPVGANGWRAAVWPDLSPGKAFLAVDDLWATWAEIRTAAVLWMLPKDDPPFRFLGRRMLAVLFPNAEIPFV